MNRLDAFQARMVVLIRRNISAPFATITLFITGGLLLAAAHVGTFMGSI